jgi:hypothetical protein
LGEEGEGSLEDYGEKGGRGLGFIEEREMHEHDGLVGLCCNVTDRLLVVCRAVDLERRSNRKKKKKRQAEASCEGSEGREHAATVDKLFMPSHSIALRFFLLIPKSRKQRRD